MIDHVGVIVRNYEASRLFYQKALAPLGYSLWMEFGEVAGFGIEGHPDFWIEGEAHGGTKGPRTHVAFRATDRHAVEEFYRLALSAGGTDNGPPGLRTDYAPNYYAAYVLDPDGNNVEAVCHE